MKLREREMPLDPEVERELEAIDRGLGGEPVDPDLEGLAELARALREERVGAEPGFAARLDQRVADGFPRPGRLAGLRKRLTAAPPRRILAPAGAAATLLVVVGVAVSQSGEIGGGDDGFSTQPVPQPADQPTVGEDAAGGAPATGEATETGRLGGQTTSGVVQSSGRSASEVPPAKRKIARRVDLALSASPDRFRDAADGVLDVVRDHRGFVVRSSVSGSDPDVTRSQLGHASFELRIPAGELPAAMGDLSDLGHVVSRTDGTRDITSRFVSVKKRIAALEETRQNLLRQLAEAVTPIEQESIKRRLAIVEEQLSAAQADLGAAQQRVHLVPVSVTIDADPALAGDGDAGGWSLGDAVGDAGKVLSVTAGVLLVSAAVLGPLAILAVLIWLVARTLARLRRERALDQI
ncbi:MAG: DUF4349 domain-containing protein [Actinomycetota bacterium]